MSSPLWSIIPFVALLSVALVPLVNGLGWRKNENGSLCSGVSHLVPFSYIYGWQEGLSSVFWKLWPLDFVPFIILLFGLFATAGASWWTDVWRAHRRRMHYPSSTFMASWIGTTGVADVAIRPLTASMHGASMFRTSWSSLIFLVANMGGCLTPLGDPPLFMDSSEAYLCMDIPADADPSGEYGHPFCRFLPDGSPLLQKGSGGRTHAGGDQGGRSGEPLIHIDGSAIFSTSASSSSASSPMVSCRNMYHSSRMGQG